MSLSLCFDTLLRPIFQFKILLMIKKIQEGKYSFSRLLSSLDCCLIDKTFHLIAFENTSRKIFSVVVQRLSKAS